jgi:trigger factor
MHDLHLEELSACKRKLSVRIPSANVKEAVRLGWANAQRQVSMKGFRPGKVPRSMLEKMYGEQIRKEIKQHLVNTAFRDAVTKHSLRPVLSPRIDLTNLAIDGGQDLSFELDFDVVPHFEVKDYKGVEVKAPVVAVTDELVEREIMGLRSRLAKPQPVTDGGAAKGDYLRVKLAIKVDGNAVKSVDDAVVDTNGDTIDGIPANGGTSAFVGQTIGGTVTVNATWPQGYEPATFADSPCELVCEILEITRFDVPELDEAFVQQFGLESVDDFKAKVREQVENTLQARRHRFIEERVFDEVLGRTELAMPEDSLKVLAEQGVHRLAHEMMRAGTPEKEAHERAESHLPRIREQNERSLRVSFLVDRIAAIESVSVSEQDLENAVRHLAMQQRRDPQQLADEMIANDQVGQLRAQVLEAKVRRLLREAAKVIDVEPSTVATEPAK